MHGDGGVDQVTPQASEPREGSIFVGAGEAGVSDDVRDQDRRELSGLAHSSGGFCEAFTPRIGLQSSPFAATSAYPDEVGWSWFSIDLLGEQAFHIG